MEYHAGPCTKTVQIGANTQHLCLIDGITGENGFTGGDLKTASIAPDTESKRDEFGLFGQFRW